MTGPDLSAADQPPERCAFGARRRGDQRYGTAPPVTRWLLVERPGPWGRDALRQSRMDQSIADRIATRAAGAGVRLLLLRRAGRSRLASSHRWAYVDSRLGSEGCWWGEYRDDADLLDLPLSAPAGPPTTEPVYLVCAHGGHDGCCAILGRPVAAELAARRPDASWECSHVGGDRFAANLVVLPYGLYYGHVPPGAVAGVLAAHEAGRVVPQWLRGRSALAGPVQAAQHHARLTTGEYGLDALPPLRMDRLGTAAWRVELAGASGPIAVTVRASTASPARLTCSATWLQAPRTYDVLALEPAAETQS